VVTYCWEEAHRMTQTRWTLAGRVAVVAAAVLVVVAFLWTISLAGL
jgi:hypothetical protein